MKITVLTNFSTENILSTVPLEKGRLNRSSESSRTLGSIRGGRQLVPHLSVTFPVNCKVATCMFNDLHHEELTGQQGSI